MIHSRILFYLPFIKTGGLENVAISYLKELNKRNINVDLIIDFDMGTEGNTLEYKIPEGINFEYIKSKSVSKLIYTFRTLGKKHKIYNLVLYLLIVFFDFMYSSKTKRVLIKGNYTHVISFYQFLPSNVTRYKSSKHIIWLHGSVEFYFKGIKKLFKNAYQKKLMKYDKIVSISLDMVKEVNLFFPKISPKKNLLCHNPFDFEYILDQSTKIGESDKNLLNEKYICSVGRLDENQKDFSTLIYSYKRCIDEISDFPKLYIIGNGPDYKKLEELVRVLDIANRIIFLGRKNNPYIWIRNSEMLVLSTNFEGLPTVLIESMILETFTISSDCKTGPREILDNGNCGDLFEIGDVDQLSKILINAVNNKQHVTNKISQASEKVKIFHKDVVFNKFLKML